jgi:hypothetical protein
VPAARLFTNELNMAISKAARATKPLFITSALRQEVGHWLFLESWSGFVPWKTEKHHQVKIYSDASSYAWGGVLNPDEISVVISDYWPDDDLTKDIVTKEALPCLVCFLRSPITSRIPGLTSMSTVFHWYSRTWNSQGARSHSFAEALKSVFVVASFENIHLTFSTFHRASMLRILHLEPCPSRIPSWPVLHGLQSKDILGVSSVIPLTLWHSLPMPWSTFKVQGSPSFLLFQHPAVLG